MAENLSLVAQLIIDRTKALVAIQELHKPVDNYPFCSHCWRNGGFDGALQVLWPCPTRKLADEGLGGGQGG